MKEMTSTLARCIIGAVTGTLKTLQLEGNLDQASASTTRRNISTAPVIFLLTFFIGLTFLTGCSGTKKIKITEKNKDKLMEQIRDSKDLSVGEVQLLQASIFRSVVSGHDPLPVGKTIGEIIDDQRKFSTESDKRDKEEKQRVAKAKSIADEKRKVLLTALTVTQFDKGFEHIEYRDYNTMKFSYENRSGRDIRGFKGTVTYKDLFGDDITNLNLKEDRTIKAGETVQVSKQVDYNQFMEIDKKLRATSLDNMKIIWQPEVILFTDGSQLSVEPE